MYFCTVLLYTDQYLRSGEPGTNRQEPHDRVRVTFIYFAPKILKILLKSTLTPAQSIIAEECSNMH